MSNPMTFEFNEIFSRQQYSSNTNISIVSNQRLSPVLPSMDATLLSTPSWSLLETSIKINYGDYKVKVKRN